MHETKKKDYKRYIVVGHSRSGTTITHLCLKGHPNISAVNDEVKVSPLFTQGIATFTTSADSYLTTKEKREGISALFDAITTIETDENTIATGLKVAIGSPEKAVQLVGCLQTYLKDLTVILTVRDDIIAQYGSRLRSSATGQAHSWRSNRLNHEFRVTIPRDKFASYAVSALKTLEELRKLKATHQVIEVVYERDILPNNHEVYYKIFEFLGLPKVEISWLDSKKVAPPPEKYILNYFELKRLLESIQETDENLDLYLKSNSKPKIYAKLRGNLQTAKHKFKKIQEVLQE